MENKKNKVKKKNFGKIFENEFKNSIEKETDTYVYRLRDLSFKFKNVDNVGDFLLFRKKTLFLFELKATQQKSLSLNNVRINQIVGLYTTTQKEDIKGGLIVKFYTTNTEKQQITEQEVFYISIFDFINYFVNNSNKKSIPIKYFRDNCYKLNQELIRVNYKYYCCDFLDNLTHKNNDEIYNESHINFINNLNK